MLKEDYNISITGRQFYDGDSDKIVLDTSGTYTQRAGSRFIAYREYDEEDPKIAHTSILKVEDGKVTMMRSGSATRLILEKGKRHRCLYDTGYGTLTVGVFTSELQSDLKCKGGKLNIKYTLDIDSNLSSKNEVTVEVKPKRMEKPL